MHYIVTLRHTDGSTHYAKDDMNATSDIDDALVLTSERKAANLVEKWNERIADSPVPTAVYENDGWITVQLDVPYTSPTFASAVVFLALKG